MKFEFNNPNKFCDQIKEALAEKTLNKIEEEREYLGKNLFKEKEDDGYDKVFKAVAKHLKVDPEKVDEMDKDTREKFYSTLDKCWDADEDKIPDGCPVDIPGEEEIENES